MMFVINLFKQRWLLIVVLLLAMVAVRYQSDVLAAPLYQTVPAPTLTSPSTPIPTATPVPDNNDDDDDDDDNQPAPTATPIPPTPTPEGLTATVSVVRLNVRQGPSLDFAVLGVVTNGQTVRVLARDETADWWQICCLPGTNTPGWVSAQFVQANFDRGQVTTLVPVADELPTPPTPTATADPLQTPDTTTDPVAGGATGATLLLTIQQDPLYTWQGQTVDLRYDITNPTDMSAENIQLRNELPNTLAFVDFVEIAGGTVMTETTEAATTSFLVELPELAAGATEVIQVRVQVTDTISNGAVINNLAVVSADERDAVTAGISIGMPPQTIPDFQ